MKTDQEIKEKLFETMFDITFRQNQIYNDKDIAKVAYLIDQLEISTNGELYRLKELIRINGFKQ